MVRFEFEVFEDFLEEAGAYQPMEVGIRANYATQPVQSPPQEPGMPPMPPLVRVVGYLTLTAATDQRAATHTKVVASQVIQAGQPAKELEAAVEKARAEVQAAILIKHEDATIFNGAVSL